MDASDLFESFLMVVPVAILAVPLFLVVLLITGLGRRWLTPRARYALWSIVLLRLLLLASVSSPFSMQPMMGWMFQCVVSLFDSPTAVQDIHWPQAALPDVPLNAQENGVVRQPILAAAPQDPVSAAMTFLDILMEILLPATILLGMLLMTAWTIITTVRLYRRVAHATECGNEDWLALLAEGQRLFGVGGQVSLRTVPGLNCPATCGWWRPVILLPDDAATWTATELRHVVWHELAHISRNDVASNWLLAAIRILHWWNPVYWYAQSAWMAERELICDSLVLRYLTGSNPSDYGKTLLRFLERLNGASDGLPASMTPGFVNFLGQKRVVRRRLEQLCQLATPVSRWRRAAGATLIAALILTGLTDAAIPPRREARVTPIDLPSGTTLRFLNFDDRDTGSLMKVVTYDLTAAIARLQQDNPELTAEAAARDLSQQLQRILDPSRSSCREVGTQLVVRSTDEQLDRIRSLLNRWAEHGRLVVQIETIILTTEGSLKDLLPETGGEVIQTGGI
jgi:bla regulator protein BlaR1